MHVIRTSAFARAGLIGNPSDGYKGKTIAFSVRDYSADVALYEWPTVEIIPNSLDLNCFDSVQALVSQIERHGYYGGTRLIKAAIKHFVDYCTGKQIQLHNRNFALRYASTIPQQVGMAGSSAIIIATLRALMQFYQVAIDQRVLPSLALQVEQGELGISGGLQDRVAQVYEGVVAMDFSSSESIDGFDIGSYQALDPALLPPLYVAYRGETSEPTEVFHNNLRARFNAGDKTVIAAMSQFAALTDVALNALTNGDHGTLHQAINDNFDLRASVCDLNPAHKQMVQVARESGASAKYAGSGGAIVGTYTDNRQYHELHKRLTAIGCTIFKPTISQ